MASTIQDDKKPVEEGRSNKINKAETSLRDQIPAKLLNKVEELDLGEKIRKIWATGNADRSEWLLRQREYLSDWDEFVDVTDQGPFVGSSNLHLPIPFIVAKTFHSRMLQAIDNAEPGVKPRRADHIQSAQMLQGLLAYTLKEWVNNYEGISEVLDNWVWTWVTTGVGIIKTRWDTKFSRYIDVARRPVIGAPEIVTDEQGNDFAVPNLEFEEFEQEVVRKTFEGPCIEWVQPEDVLILQGEGDPQKSEVVIHRQYLTASDMWMLADRKVFKEDAVKEIIEGGEDLRSGALNSEIKQERSQNAGKGQLDTEADLDRYEILECYMKTDVDGSGINSDIIVWVHERTSTVLRANYLHRVNKAGMRPFTKIDFYKRPGEDMGMGLIEVLHPITKEMDAMHNMRIDFGLLSTMPFGFYRPSSSLKPEKIKLEPGSLIPLDNPQTDVVFPNLGNRTTFGFNEENALMNIVERLTGVSDVTLGIVSGSQGATRTATGTRALQAESNANLNVHLRRLVRGWKQFLQYLVHMLQQRIPPGFEFRVTGEDGDDYFARVRDQIDIAGDFDFEVSTDSTQSNPTVQQGIASQILQMVNNPLYIQAGTVDAGNIFEAQKNFLKSMGVMDWSRFVKKPAQHKVIITPEEELNRIIRGIPVPVTLEMDHEGFIEFAQQVLNSDELFKQFVGPDAPEEQAAVLIQAQMQQHQQAANALAQAQAQAANAQQQLINIQQGSPQGDVTPPGGAQDSEA